MEPQRPDAGAPDRVAKPTSLGDVARRITSRTTDLLAVSVVLVASLTFGRQILQWWHASPPDAGVSGDALLPAPGWEDERQSLSLEFGDLPLALTRQVVMGDRAAAVAALVGHCRAGAIDAKCPVHEPDEAEQRLIEKVAGLKPVAEQAGEAPAVTPVAGKNRETAGDWQVYVVDERFTLVVAVRRFPDGGAGVPPSDEQAERLHHKSERGSGSNGTARKVQRLVCWGIAMPTGENAWTLYVFRQSPAGGTSASGQPTVPLPPGANRNLSLRDERGGLMLGFSGSGLAQNWMTFYDDWFAGQGWAKSDHWSTGKQTWSVRFIKPGFPEAGRIEIRIAVDQKGELTGLLQSQ